MDAPDATLSLILQRLDALDARLSAPPVRFLSVKAAAIYTSLSEDSIRALIERRDLIAYRPLAGKVLIDREQLDRLIHGSTRTPRNGRGSGLRAYRENKQKTG